MTDRINLAGEWLFSLDGDKTGIENELFAKTLSDTITLPGTVSLAKKGEYSDKKEIGYLTDPYEFSGYAWYQKKVTLASYNKNSTYLLHLERTRLTELWVDGVHAGSFDSLTTPHNYNITKFISSPEFILTILVKNCDYPTKGGHLTSPDTQTNWNGIIGEISITEYGSAYIENAAISYNSYTKEVTANISINNKNGSSLNDFSLAVSCGIVTPESFLADTSISEPNSVLSNDTLNVKAYSEIATKKPAFESDSSEVTISFSSDFFTLWSEYTTSLYDFKFELIDSTGNIIDSYHTLSGIRDISKNEHYFLVNGVETFLRGKHDGLIFPITAAVPTSVKEWLRIMSIAKSYGINHYRFHTCCPPEAAFTAADLLGIYMEPQLPFWGTIAGPDDEGYNKIELDYLIEEGFRMMKAFGNHPSFALMSLGNELWGNKEVLNSIIASYKAVDRRHLYTQGSNNFQHTPVILPEDDFFVGVRFSKQRLIRGSYGMCDAPLGHIQWEAPSTNHNYDPYIIPDSSLNGSSLEAEDIEIQYGTGVKKVKAVSNDDVLIPHIPVVTHEIGQFAIYPNFREIEKYTGVLKARSFEIFRDRLLEKGMLDEADDFFRASGMLSCACYKEELEAAARSSLVAGYQILDIQDFTGQGTALVGILDSFMDSKGLITPAEWQKFCSDRILMAEFDKYVYTAGDDLNISIKLRYYAPENIAGHSVIFRLIPSDNDCILENGTIYENKSIQIPENHHGLTCLGNYSIKIPDIKTSAAYTLALSIEGTDISNSYEIYVYPKSDIDYSSVESAADISSDTRAANISNVHITDSIDKAEVLLESGEAVLFIPKSVELSIPGFYCTDFWCYPMFRDICNWMKKPVAVGTMGLLIKDKHPALKNMLSTYYSTPQWYEIVSHADCAILDDTTEKSFRPIISMIDNFDRNHKLGILYEGKCLNGRLMVCTSRLSEIIDRPEVKQFLSSIIAYMESDSFAPTDVLDFELVKKNFVKA